MITCWQHPKSERWAIVDREDAHSIYLYLTEPRTVKPLRDALVLSLVPPVEVEQVRAWHRAGPPPLARGYASEAAVRTNLPLCFDLHWSEDGESVVVAVEHSFLALVTTGASYSKAISREGPWGRPWSDAALQDAFGSATIAGIVKEWTREKNILEDIATYGWSGTIVEEDACGPGFEYTIGLMERFNHPEVIVFGLNNETMHDILWAMFREVQAGRSFAEPGVYSGILERFACAIRPVHEEWHTEYLGYAMWHRRYVGKMGDLRAVQCVWPDRNGHFPSGTCCDPEIALRQPDLSCNRGCTQ